MSINFINVKPVRSKIVLIQWFCSENKVSSKTMVMNTSYYNH